MKLCIAIALSILCCIGSSHACHYCNPYYAERVIVASPCYPGATVMYSNPCYPPYCPPYPYVYEERHYVHPYPSSGYNFQFGYTSGGGHGGHHGRHHGGHHGGHGDGYSFSIGGFSIGR